MSAATLFLGCLPGFFGPRCKRTCTLCLNGAYCDLMNGSCVCAPGYFGEYCANRMYISVRMFVYVVYAP